MKMSKKEGLEMLKILNLPTVELIDQNLLDENSSILKQGLSIRTSPKLDSQNNVYLPSIHNCRNLSEIRHFVKEYQRDYNIIAHKTVIPELIGSISRYELSSTDEKIIIEFFRDFKERKNEIIKNRMYLPIVGERFLISQLEMQEKDEEDFKVFSQVLQNVKKIPFKTYDAEFVLEDGKICFTDLTIQSTIDKYLMEEIKEKNKKKKEYNLEEKI